MTYVCEPCRQLASMSVPQPADSTHIDGVNAVQLPALDISALLSDDDDDQQQVADAGHDHGGDERAVDNDDGQQTSDGDDNEEDDAADDDDDGEQQSDGDDEYNAIY